MTNICSTRNSKVRSGDIKTSPSSSTRVVPRSKRRPGDKKTLPTHTASTIPTSNRRLRLTTRPLIQFGTLISDLLTRSLCRNNANSPFTKKIASILEKVDHGIWIYDFPIYLDICEGINSKFDRCWIEHTDRGLVCLRIDKRTSDHITIHPPWKNGPMDIHLKVGFNSRIPSVRFRT